MNSTHEMQYIIEKLDDTRTKLHALEVAVAKLETKIAVYSSVAGIISGIIIGIIIKWV